MERAHLLQANRHVTLAKLYILQQEQRIARLAAKGHDTQDAEDFLDVLTKSLRTFEQHRLLILDRLGSLTPTALFPQISPTETRAYNGKQMDQGIARKAQQESEGEMEGKETQAAAEAP